MYCLVCRKDTDDIDKKVIQNSKGRYMLASRCSVCGRKKSQFIKEQEAKGLLSMLTGKKTPLSNIPLLGDILF